jgi:hypothetical protein
MPKYTRQEFAKQIKAKYAEYASWDDDWLVEQVTTKYPDYKAWVNDRDEDLAVMAGAAPPVPQLDQTRSTGPLRTGAVFAKAPSAPPAPPKVDSAFVEAQGAGMRFPAQAALAAEVGVVDPLKRLAYGASGGLLNLERTTDDTTAEGMAGIFAGGAAPYIAAKGAAIPSAVIGAVQGVGQSIETQLAAQIAQAEAAGTAPAGKINPVLAAGEAVIGAAQGYMQPAYGASKLTRLITGVGGNVALNDAQVAAQQYAATGKVDRSDPNWAPIYAMSEGAGAAVGLAGAAFKAPKPVATPAASGGVAASGAAPALPPTQINNSKVVSTRVLAPGAASGTGRQLELLLESGERTLVPFPEGADLNTTVAQFHRMGLENGRAVGNYSFPFEGGEVSKAPPEWVQPPPSGQQLLPGMPPRDLVTPPDPWQLPLFGKRVAAPPTAPAPPPVVGEQLPLRFDEAQPVAAPASADPLPPAGQQPLPFDEVWRTQAPPSGPLFPEEVPPVVGNVVAPKGQRRLPFRNTKEKGLPGGPAPEAPPLAVEPAQLQAETINLDAERKPNAGEARKLAKMGYSPAQVNDLTGAEAQRLIANNIQAKALAPASAAPKLVRTDEDLRHDRAVAALEAMAQEAQAKKKKKTQGVVPPDFEFGAHLAPAALAAAVPDDPESEQDDLLRAGLMAGSAGALAAAWYRRTGRLPYTRHEAGYSYAYLPEAQLRAFAERGKKPHFEFLSDIDAAKAKVGPGMAYRDGLVLVRVADDAALPTKNGRVPKPGATVEIFDPMRESWTGQEVAQPAGSKPRVAAPTTVTETPRIVEGPDPEGFESFRAFQAAVNAGDYERAKALKAAVTTDIATIPEGYHQEIADAYSNFQRMEAALTPYELAVDDVATAMRQQERAASKAAAATPAQAPGMAQTAPAPIQKQKPAREFGEDPAEAAQRALMESAENARRMGPQLPAKYLAAKIAGEMDGTAAQVAANLGAVPSVDATPKARKSKRDPKAVVDVGEISFGDDTTVQAAPAAQPPAKPTLRRPDGSVAVEGTAKAPAVVDGPPPPKMWEDAARAEYRRSGANFDDLSPDDQGQVIKHIKEIAAEDERGPRAFLTDMIGGGVASAAAYAAAPEDQKELAMAAAVPIPGFYSRLTRGAMSVFAKTGAKALNAASLAARVKSLASPEEIKWTGFADWLAERGQKKVTQEEVQQFLDLNEIKVEEVRLGGTTLYNKKQEFYDIAYALPSVQRIPLAERHHVLESAFQRAQRAQTRADMTVIAGEALRDGLETTARLDGTTLWGIADDLGRELWNLQRAIENPNAPVYGGSGYSRYRTSDENYREFIATLPSHKGLFESHNWEPGRSGLEPEMRGVSADAMFDSPEFTAAVNDAIGRNNAAPLLHIRTTDRILPSGRKVLVVEEIQSDLQQELRRRRGTGEPIATLEGAKLRQQAGDWDPSREGHAGHPVVDAPFSTAPGGMDWQNFALKRIIRLAAEEGYDGVFFTGGREQAARYGAPPGIAMRWENTPDGVKVYSTNAQGQEILVNTYYPGDTPEVFGEAARPILAADADPDAPQSGFMDVEQALSKTQKGNLHFYDTVVPDRVNKLLKRFGASLQNASLPRGVIRELSLDGPVGGSYMGGDFSSPTVEGKMVTVTPAMRESVMKLGFERGAVDPRLAAKMGSTAVGAVAGGAIGSQLGTTPEEKRRTALYGALAGALVGSTPIGVYERYLLRDTDARIKAMGEKVFQQIEANDPPARTPGAVVAGWKAAVADAFVPFAKLTRSMRGLGVQSADAVRAISKLHDDFYAGAQKSGETLRHILSPLESAEQYKAFFEIIRLRRNLALERRALAAGTQNKTYLMGATVQETENVLNGLIADLKSKPWAAQVQEAMDRHLAAMKAIAQIEVQQGKQPASILADDTYLPDIVLDFASEAQTTPGGATGRWAKAKKRFSQFRSEGRSTTTGSIKQTWNDYAKTVGARLVQHHIESAKITLIDNLAQVYDPNYGKGLQPAAMTVPAGYKKFQFDPQNVNSIYVLPEPVADELTVRFAAPQPWERISRAVTNFEKGYLIRSTLGGYFANNVLGDTSNNFASTPYQEWLTLGLRDMPKGIAASGMKAFSFDRPGSAGPRQNLWDFASRAETANIGIRSAAADVSQQVLADPRLRTLTNLPGRAQSPARDLTVDVVNDVQTKFTRMNAFYNSVRDFTEGINRIARFNHEVSKGLTDAQAGKVVLNAIYDYNDLTPWEARWLRSIFVPFWTFTKKSFESYAPLRLTDTGNLTPNRDAAHRWARIAPFAAAGVMWNQTFFPDAENDLATWEREQFHILVPTGWDEKRQEWDLTYIGFPTPANITARSVGAAGSLNRLADYIKGKSDTADIAEDMAAQARQFWVGLVNPAMVMPFEIAANTDFATGRRIVPPTASAGEKVVGHAVNAIGSLPPFSQVTAGAREQLEESGLDSGIVPRLLFGSVVHNVNRERNAARAVARTYAEGRARGEQAESDLRERVIGGEELPRDIYMPDGQPDLSVLPTKLNDAWLAKVFRNQRVMATVKRALATDIPREGVPPPSMLPTASGGAVEVPTIPHLAALGPDATIKMALLKKAQSASAGRTWIGAAVEAMRELRKSDARWDTTDAILGVINASPSWQEKKSIDAELDQHAVGARPLPDVVEEMTAKVMAKIRD